MMCVAPKKPLLEFDSELPGRDGLLDAETMKTRISELLGCAVATCEIVRAKYKVNSSLRVLYKIETEENEQLVSARVYARSPGRTDFYVFPKDRKIQNLRILTSPPKSMPKLWSKSRVVAYAPEKCVTVECLDSVENVFAYAKIYAEKEFETGRKVFRFLSEQAKNNQRNLFPEVLGFDEAERVLMLKKADGKRLADLDKSLSRRGFELLGCAIGEFHGISTNLELKEFSRLSKVRIEFAAKTISIARPDCKIQAESLADKLLKEYSFADEETLLLHGDVHPKNGILSDDESVTLIDFDQLSWGNAAAEIGSFLAGLHYREIIGQDSRGERREYADAFLSGYERARKLPASESLVWHTSAALFAERALRAISRVRIEGLEKFPELLAAGEAILRGDVK